MKNFSRTNLIFSLCGLNCGLCPMKLGGYCPGCGGGAGNQTCVIARCSFQHDHVEYCFLCPEYPCSRYSNIDPYDSFLTHQGQLRDIERAREIGIEAYNNQLSKRIQILEQLLSDYDDGRSKTFYCLAMNLLPLPEIEILLERTIHENAFIDLPVKEKCRQITGQFKELAQQQGILLKLRKKGS